MFFKNFPKVYYRFGEEATITSFQDLSAYADIIDAVKDTSAFYTSYYIQPNERPDQVSYKLYGSTDYHWTFYLMNDKIREQGWPLTNQQLIEYAERSYTHTAIVTRTSLNGIFKVGQTVRGTRTASTGTVVHRNLDLGIVYLRNVVGVFGQLEAINSFPDISTTETIIAESSSIEYLSPHHYEDGNGNWVDIDPEVGPGALLTEITFLDRLERTNDTLKEIRVIKPSVIGEVVKSFKEAIRS
jgi:hypothetical protein